MANSIFQIFLDSLICFASITALQYCDYDCKKGDGYFCVKDDQTAFSVCLAGQRIATKYCSNGLVFDVIQQACNWPGDIKGEQCPCLPPTTRPPPSPTTPTTRRTGPPPITRPPTSFGLKRVCYFTNWSVYRPGPASYSVANVDAFDCTHIIVAFMKLSNAEISYLETADADTLKTLTKLRNEKNPSLKILVAVGGWNAGSAPFMELLADQATTDSFVYQAIEFLRQNDLDGLDIDWEYPTGVTAKFTQWMLGMRAAFENEAKSTGLNRLLLSAAVSAGASTIDWAYDVPNLSKAVDMINLMSYDLNGAWNPTTGLNSAINSGDQFNVQFASEYWVKKGADPQKLIIGIPTYGRTFKLCNPGPTQTGVGSKACGTGNAGVFTQSAGFEAYYESCLKLQCSSGGWTTGWDNAGQSPFMHSGNQWITYETTKSIAAKVTFTQSKGYGGVMVWAIDLDDFNDMCGSGVKSPLMKTLIAAATGKPLPSLNSTPKPTVDPCDPTGSGSGGGGGGGGTSPLDVCDNKCAFDGHYCMPNSPTQFYQCSNNGQRSPPKSCDSGLFFNYLTGLCDWSANYPGCNCTLATTLTPIVVKTTTMRPHPTTKMTTTSSSIAPTTAPEPFRSTTAASNTSLDICDDKCAKDGLYCMPNNPAQFYRCLHRRRHPPTTCPNDLSFNYLTGSCDWPANYPGCKCDSSTPAPVFTSLLLALKEDATFRRANRNN